MKDALPSNRVTIDVHNNIPWRYLHIPGLYIIVLGCLIQYYLFQYMSMYSSEDPLIVLSNVVVCFFGSFLIFTGIFTCMGWYVFRDTYFRLAEGADPATTDISGTISEENFWRNIIQRYPWCHAHKIGLLLVILALFIIVREAKVYRMDPESTDWTTVLPIRVGIILAIILKLAGFTLCMGWYVFKDIDIEDTQEWET
jgi:hypothetical protein